MTTAVIKINGLHVEAIVGVRAWEREVRQTLVLDIEFAVDSARASQTDALRDTVDYGAVARRITQHISDGAFQLIETAAQTTVALLEQEFHAAKISVTVKKPSGIDTADYVSVTVTTRSRR